MNNLSKRKKKTSQSILIAIRVTHIIRFHVKKIQRRSNSDEKRAHIRYIQYIQFTKLTHQTNNLINVFVDI